MHLVSSASRASSAVSTASFAVWQPAVLGRKWMCLGMRSTRLSSSPARLMRRIEAVAISLPLAASASSITWRLGYPAVPRNKRERNSRPAITSGSDIGCSFSRLLPTLAGAHDFDGVAGVQRRFRPGRARHHLAIERDRDATLSRVDCLLLQQRSERCDAQDLVLAIDADVSFVHGRILAARTIAVGWAKAVARLLAEAKPIVRRAHAVSQSRVVRRTIGLSDGETVPTPLPTLQCLELIML